MGRPIYADKDYNIKLNHFFYQKDNDIIKQYNKMNIFHEILAFNNMFESEGVLNALVAEERKRRILVEGPPDANFRICEERGSLYKFRENGRIWDINHPCTNCDENECFAQLVELSETPPQVPSLFFTGTLAVKPNAFFRVKSAPASSKTCTVCAFPYLAAIMSGVVWLGDSASIYAKLSSSKRKVFKLALVAA